MNGYYASRQIEFGYTTPARAADTARFLRETLKSDLQSVAEEATCIASLVIGPDPEPRIFALAPGDVDPWRIRQPADPLVIRPIIQVFEEASRSRSTTVAIPLLTVLAAKEYIGKYREHTICVGMSVAWIEGVPGGDWAAGTFTSGEVIGISCDSAAVTGMSVNAPAVRSSRADGQQIAVVSIYNLRSEPCDLY